MKNILDKMASRGVEALSDRELLALLTDDEQLAEVVLSAYDGSLARIGDQPEARLRMVGGLGLKRARMLLAAAEFGRAGCRFRGFRERFHQYGRRCGAAVPAAAGTPLPRGVLGRLPHLVEPGYRALPHQSGRGDRHGRRPPADRQTGVGTARHAADSGAQPPFGNAEASGQDKTLTERVARAAALFDIRLLDHIIIARDGDFSFLREGLMGR